ncbi:hypothetical protein GC174_08505 [bacterium]|nr:hypothetical protein [bacterium]
MTVFKDGHALVLHRGLMKTDTAGNVVMDDLPKPVLGTFWPFCSDRRARLSMAVAGVRRVSVSNTSLTVPELIEGNIGARVRVLLKPRSVAYGEGRADVRDHVSSVIEGSIESVPARSSEEMERTAPDRTDRKLPRRGDVVMIRTEEGLRAEPFDNIESIAFKGEVESSLSHEELRNLITLKLDWQGDKPKPAADAGSHPRADVGMIYLQEGIRWVPSYKVIIDGNGKAVVLLNATVENRLRDLKDIRLDLVVGVPTFPFKDQIDPFALNGSVADVVRRLDRNSIIASQFSNAAILQGATNGTIGAQAADYSSNEPSFSDAPRVDSGTKNEDMFVYTVEHVSLAKGERMVLPVARYELDYEDVYSLDLPFGAPFEVPRSYNQETVKYEKLLKAPRVMHKLRIKNKGRQPFTTAPTLLVSADQKTGRETVLGQSLMTYTACGARVDLDLGTAIDFAVKRDDVETSRQPDAVKWQDDKYCRVNHKSSITITNFSKRAAALEVERNLFGFVDGAGEGAAVKRTNFFENAVEADSGSRHPYWWNYYSFPHWWHSVNGSSSIKWNTRLAPGAKVSLDYRWHYFWR